MVSIEKASDPYSCLKFHHRPRTQGFHLLSDYVVFECDQSSQHLTENPLGVGGQDRVPDMKPGPKPLIVKLPKHGRQSLDISVTETVTDSFSHDKYGLLVLTHRAELGRDITSWDHRILFWTFSK